MNQMNRPAFFAAIALSLLILTPWTHAVELPHYTGELVPRPQQVLKDWQTISLEKGVSVQSPKQPNGALSLGIQLLNQRLASVGVKVSDGGPVRLVLGGRDEPAVRDALAAIGADTSKLILPPQGYVIRVGQSAGHTIVVGTADQPRGMFYAAATLIQMIGKPDGQPILKIADMNDWPTWPHRFLGDYGPPAPDKIEQLALYKVGGISFQHRYEWRQFAADIKPRYGGFATYGEALKALKKFKDQTGLVDYMLILNIYAASPRKDPIFDVTSKKDMDALTSRLEFAASMGVDRIMVSADDWTPMEDGGYVSPNKDERERFGPSAGAAHGYLMRQLYDRLKPQFPDLQLYFCPAPYSVWHITRDDPPKQERYLMELAERLPPDVRVVWTGPTVTSPLVTKKDELRYSEYVLHQPLLLWNNTSNTPGMRQFDNRVYDGFAADSNGIIYIDSFTFTQAWSQAYSLNANDYLWKPDGFDMEGSFRQIVEKQYGVGAYAPVNAYILGQRRLVNAQKKHDSKAAMAAIQYIRRAIEGIKEKKMAWWLLEGIVNQQAAQYEAKPPHVEVPSLGGAPKMDGKLDDAAWKKAARLSTFQAYTKGQKVDQTTGLIGYDHEALYLAFSATHTKPLLPRTTPKAHDAPIFATGDAIEIFLLDRSGGKTLHLAFDAQGDRFDEASGLRASWNPDWQVVTGVSDEHTWTAEVRIPFASLKPLFAQAPKAGVTWFGNFCRSNSIDGQLSSWSPTYGNSFHEHAFFGKLEFGKLP